jgi:hypothetical protein
MMDKKEYTEIFDIFAKTSIKMGDYGFYLYGHNVCVEFMSDVWDVYICNQKEFRKGDYQALLSGKLLNLVRDSLPSGIKYNRLDGEAYFQTKDIHWLKGWLFENRKRLGIAKRKAVSPNSNINLRGSK